MAAAAQRATAAVVSAYASTVLADGPAAYYALADTGPTVADGSGNGHNGTAGSSVVFRANAIVAGDPRSAANFPGGAQSAPVVASVPASSGLAPATAVTLEAWVRPGTAGESAPILSYGNNTLHEPYQPYWLHLDNGQVDFGVANGSANWWFAQSATVLQASVTYHVVATYDGRYERIYVNGKLDATRDCGTTAKITDYDSTNGLTLGSDTVASNGAVSFKGTLQDVAIYTTALGADRISAHYTAGTTPATPPPTPVPTPPAPNPYAAGIAGDKPLAYYPLSEGGPTMTDASGNGQNGRYGTSVSAGAAGIVAGDGRTALALPGGSWKTGSLAVAPASSALAPRQAISVEAWVEPSDANASEAILSYGNNNQPQPYQPYWLHLDGGQVNFGVAVSGNWWFAQSNTVLAAGKVYHVVGTFDGRYERVYINGVLDQTYDSGGTSTITNYDATNGLTLGGDTVADGTALFKGTLQDVAIYGSALSASTVAAHYRLGVTAPSATSNGGVTSPPTAAPTVKPTIAPTPVPTAPPTAPAQPAGGPVNGQDWPAAFHPYGAQSVWNNRVCNAANNNCATHPTYASYSATAVARQFSQSPQNPQPEWMEEPGQYDYYHPIYFASNSDPLINVICNQYCGTAGSDYPLQIRIPAQARPAGGQDAHIAVVQPNGEEIDFFGAYGTPGSNATYGAVHNQQTRNWQNGDTLTAGNVNDCGSFYTGPGFHQNDNKPYSTATGACLGGGIVTASELLAGVVPHAIAFAPACGVNGGQYPATTNATTDSPCTSGVGAPPGARLWYDVDDAVTTADPTLDRYTKAILVALHDYGAFNMDTGNTTQDNFGFNFQMLSAQTQVSFGAGNPAAALGWGANTIANVDGKGTSGIRYTYMDPFSPQGLDWTSHFHYLAPCSAQSTC